MTLPLLPLLNYKQYNEDFFGQIHTCFQKMVFFMTKARFHGIQNQIMNMPSLENSGITTNWTVRMFLSIQNKIKHLEFKTQVSRPFQIFSYSRN